MTDMIHNQIPEASTEEERIYKENVIDHYRGAFSPCTFRHREINASCGDDLEMFVTVESGKISRIAFVGRGCAVSQAAVSMLTEHVQGKMLVEIETMGKDAMIGLLGIPIGPSRLKCALLGLKTLQNGMVKNKI